MLVSELRELIKKYKEEDLRLLIVEMYKSMPKKLREDKEIDELLQDAHAYMRKGKIDKKQNKQIDIHDLKQEIDLFIDYAYKQYYFAPNSFVHKKERPKWRFKVKTYIKDLQGISVDSTDGKVATDLLQKLYNMLCYACRYYIFSTDNPFRSVGIEQPVLIDTIISRKIGNGINNESIKSAIELVINSALDRETLHSYLIEMLMMNLKSPDAKTIAIEQCKVLKKELDKAKPIKSKKSWSFDTSYYDREEKISNLVEIIFKTNIQLCEYDEAIRYFKQNYVRSDKEVALYVLLRLLMEYDLKELWIREYKEAVQKGIKIRESLHKTYKYIKENDKLPEYIMH